MPSIREVAALNRGIHSDGRSVTKAERERLLKPYLPTPPSLHPSPSACKTYSDGTRPAKLSFTRLHRPHGVRLRSFLLFLIHCFLYWTIQLVFSFYIRGRQVYHGFLDRVFTILYYHHRTAALIRKDVRNLNRLPKHLSVIVSFDGHEAPQRHKRQAISKLIKDVADLATWSTCAGIPMLSIYEQTGILKTQIPSLHRAITHTLRSYNLSAPPQPIHIRAPNQPAYSPPSTPSPPASPPTRSPPTPLNILLLSSADGRPTLVDLTKTLTEMSQRGRLHPSDISAELIDAEITESSCGEPDLLVLMAASAYRTQRSRGGESRRLMSPSLGEKFSERDRGEKGYPGEEVVRGGEVCLRGYPPWQVRLTEIFHVRDNAGVRYHVFLRALHKYAKAELRFGR